VDFIAKDWAAFARLAGMTVKAVPVAGAIVVWQPGVEGAAGESGHVGYVESVANGRFTTSEENFGAPYQMGSRTLSAAPIRGRLFIYP
jgi:surface antigen